MGWWAVAAAAAPYVIGALQKKPKQPQYKPVSQVPARDAYYRAMVDTAFNPNSREFQMASEGVQDQVNRALAMQGLGGSSVGMASLANAQASMAGDFMRNQQAERMKAVQAMTGYDAEKLKINNAIAQQNYERDMQAYNTALQRQAGVAQGIGNIAGAYAQYQGRQDDRAWYKDMVGEYGTRVAPAVGSQFSQPYQYGSVGYSQANPFSYQSPYGMGGYGF
jgi:hypothetical protein